MGRKEFDSTHQILSESGNGKVYETGGVEFRGRERNSAGEGKNANVANSVPKLIYRPNFIRTG